jgi:hypothetical protein
MKFTFAVALLIASSQAIRLRTAPVDIVCKLQDAACKDRAKSESMPGTATPTDTSNGGTMTHGEAKVNQADLARYNKHSATVDTNAATREGPIHTELGDKASTYATRAPIPYSAAFAS